METMIAEFPVVDLREPIPGYVLQERIGVGGFGEVWRAEAPGGLQKAIKIVFSSTANQRREAELQALNRIKCVQHPLLLSLERFEVIDDRLLIVTELAQGSLRNRFEEYTAAGLPGIPRAELLTYLRDAADALDYLFEHFSLQHLDVKPENLLLQGNHVKVSDFGLVRDLKDKGDSLLAGLTPLYAAPELFEGSPSRHSDQYSLAIVYQELLTGEPPFSGRTPAQLAAQHRYSSPRISPLPRSDQLTISRALAKAPDRRFANCRELVERLANVSCRAGEARRSTAAQHSPRQSTPDGSVADRPDGPRPILDFPASREVRAVPPLPTKARSSALGPTVFVGVGGTAARTLVHLRKRLLDRLGSQGGNPTIQMLLFDTQAAELSAVAGRKQADRLRAGETVAIPLRGTHEYLGQAQQLTEWLDRRWLYNIPRSLRTEGIRPLGRLALVDHFSDVAESLLRAIGDAHSADTSRVAAMATKMETQVGSLRVFVIASTAGGTGGGVALDLGYAIQALLETAGVPGSRTYGVLLHSTSRRSHVRDLALANTLSLLQELNHYTSCGGYPGEPACNLGRSSAGPFHETYFVHLGDDLDDEAFDEATQGVAEYLYQCSATAASGYLEQCRMAGDSDPRSPGTVRTFGVRQVQAGVEELPESVTEALCEALLHRWSGSEGADGPRARVSDQDCSEVFQEIDSLTSRFCGNIGLQLDRLVHTAEEVVAHETGDDMLRYCRKVLGPAWAGQRADVGAKGLCGVIDRALLENETAAESSLHGNLQSILDARFQAASTTQAETIRGWLFALVETPKARIRGARHAARWLAKWLDNLQRETTSVLLRLAHEAESLQASAVNEASLLQYAAARVRCVPHLGVRKYLRGLRRLVQACDEEFSELARSARQLARQFATQGPKEAAGLPAHGGSLPTRLARLLQESRDELVNRFDHSLGKAMAGQEGTVASLLHGRPEQVAEWIRLMRSTACGLLRESLQAGSSPMQAGSGPRQASTVPWQVALEKASPRLLECGGTKRLIVVSPDKQAEARVGWLRSLVSLAKQDPAVFTTANCPTAICYEVEHVPLENVAVALAVDRPECLRLVPRLHTRTDVEWTPLLPSEDSR